MKVATRCWAQKCFWSKNDIFSTVYTNSNLIKICGSILTNLCNNEFQVRGKKIIKNSEDYKTAQISCPKQMWWSLFSRNKIKCDWQTVKDTYLLISNINVISVLDVWGVSINARLVEGFIQFRNWLWALSPALITYIFAILQFLFISITLLALSSFIYAQQLPRKVDLKNSETDARPAAAPVSADKTKMVKIVKKTTKVSIKNTFPLTNYKKYNLLYKSS